MPKYLTTTFIGQIDSKKKNGTVIIPLLLLFLFLASNDWYYRYITYDVIFAPDYIHTLLIDLSVAYAATLIIILLPKFLRVITFTSFMTIIFTLTGILLYLNMYGYQPYSLSSVSGIQFSFVDFVKLLPYTIWVLLIPILLIGFFKSHVSVKRWLLHLNLFILTVVSSVLYLSSAVYNNNLEEQTNFDLLSEADTNHLVRGRLSITSYLLNGITSGIEQDQSFEDIGNYLTKVGYGTSEDFSISKRETIVVIEVEGLTKQLVNPSIMPFVSAAIDTETVFTNYYSQPELIQTEAMNDSLMNGIPNLVNQDDELFYGTNRYPFAIPNILRTKGYVTKFITDEELSNIEIRRLGEFGFQSYDQSSNVVGVLSQVLQQSDQQFVYAHISSLIQSTEDVLDIYKNARQIDSALESFVQDMQYRSALEPTKVILVSGSANANLDRLTTLNYQYDNHERYESYMILFDKGNVKITEPLTDYNVPATLLSTLEIKPTFSYIGTSVFASGQNIVSFQNGDWVSNAGAYDAQKQQFVVSDPIYLTDFLSVYIKNTNSVVKDRYEIAKLIQETNYYLLRSV